MTTTPLFDPPPVHTLPVSWHGDLIVDFQNVDPDSVDPENPDPLNYDAGVTAYLDIKTSPTPQRFTATIVDSIASIRVESTVADAFAKKTKWAFILSYPGTPSTEIVVANGEIARYDGDT
ncbi:DUF7264 domain-containing protein [Nocardia brasiliensis]|uniref:LtfC-like domain-containing protein n=1 Tax=Nocardia brasiliensis TaxID=37326 RepID=UPI0024543F08|nr:hypothetical protein [Nocardia brasiliensis]